MRYLLTLLFIMNSFCLGSTPQFSLGKWKMVDAGCSNPEYKYSEDEKFFIEAIKSGRTVDIYEFKDSMSGVYNTRFQFDDNGYCEGKTKFEITYPKDGETVFQMGNTEWKFVPLKPNVTIKCNEEGQTKFQYFYKWNGSDIVFWIQSDPSCGIYQYFWKKQ